jgi:hypothetical protein
MDLDRHASRAAEDLRRRVETQVDLPAARASFDAAARRRRAGAARTRMGLIGVAAAVLALVGLVSVAGGPGLGDGDLTTDANALDGLDGETSGAARSAAILNALPRGPIDGKASWRLPVVVKPQTGLRDGGTVTVYGRGFEPDQSLGIVQCTAEADTGASGVGACQLAADGQAGGFGRVTYATASAEGTVVAEFVVRRYVTTPEGGRVDCRSAPERCLIGVGAVSNYDQSGGAYIDFAGAPPFAQPELTVEPGGPYGPGQEVVARTTGLVPLRGYRMQQCKGEVCENLGDATADAEGTVTAAVVLQPTVDGPETGDEVSCDGGCVLRLNGIGVKGGSSAPLPDDVPIAFTDAPVTTTAPVETTVPETTTVPGDPSTTTVPVTADAPVTTTSILSEDPVTTTSVPGS